MINESFPPASGAGHSESIDEAVAATHRLIETLRKTSGDNEAVRIPVTFKAPGSIEHKLSLQEQAYSDEFDRLDSTRPTHADVRSELARKGMHTAPTAEEVEAQEEARQAHLRAHAKNSHKPRTSSSKVIWRPKGSIQRDIADNDQKAKTERELHGDIL